MYDKYFVIGMNKTATVTFDHIFKKNGLKSIHDHNIKNWDLKKYDCFSDIGHEYDTYYNSLLKHCKCNIKNAIFILNIREMDKWLKSRFKHGIKYNQDWAKPASVELTKEWIYDRERYHKDILEYFKDQPEKLIIVNIDKEGWEDYINTRLNFKQQSITPQHVNKTDMNNSEHINLIKIVDDTLESLNYKSDTVLLEDESLVEEYKKIYDNYM